MVELIIVAAALVLFWSSVKIIRDLLNKSVQQAVKNIDIAFEENDADIDVRRANLKRKLEADLAAAKAS